MRKMEGTMKQKKKLGIIIAVAIAIIVVGVVILFALKANKSSSQKETKETNEYEIVKPGKDTLDVSKIQGYSAKVGDSDKNDDSKETEKADQIVLSDPNLTVESIGAYSGSFIEDGSDEATKNVTAMLITNNSDQMLQVALIDFQVNSNETASFKVTNLPAGTSTLVLESNKREFSDKDTYTYGNAATGYMDQPTLEEDKVELKTENGKITLKNKTDKELKRVYVYYKYVQIGGAYFGGITYRTPFENVGAGKEAEAVAAHFNPDSSQIMGVQILEN
jgi:cytoskeletal protein RodZ